MPLKIFFSCKYENEITFCTTFRWTFHDALMLCEGSQVKNPLGTWLSLGNQPPYEAPGDH